MLSIPKVKYLGWIIIFFSSALSAESSLEQGADTITLHDAINRTIERNPSLRTFGYQRKAREGKSLHASLKPATEIGFSVEDALGSGDYKGLDGAQATLGITWVLEGDKRQGYMDVASAGTQSVSTEVDIRRLDAAAETARLYYIHLANQARLANAGNKVKLTQATVSTIRKRVTVGKTTEAELARAQARVFRSLLEREDIEHELTTASRLLAAQWGDTQPNFTRVAGDLFKLPNTISFEILQSRLEQSPEYMRVISERRLQQAELSLAKAKSKPDWRVNFGIRHDESTNDQALIAGISIPFGERTRNTGRILEAQATLSQVDAKENETRVRYLTSLYVLHQELQHSLHRADAYHKKIIPQLDKALRETGRAYNLGRYSYLEWQSIQAELFEAQAALLEASVDAHLKAIEIEHLTGESITQQTPEL